MSMQAKMASPDKTFSNMKSCSHILWAAGLWTVHHVKGHAHDEPITTGIFIEKETVMRRDNSPHEPRFFFSLRFIKAD